MLGMYNSIYAGRAGGLPKHSKGTRGKPRVNKKGGTAQTKYGKNNAQKGGRQKTGVRGNKKIPTTLPKKHGPQPPRKGPVQKTKPTIQKPTHKTPRKASVKKTKPAIQGPRPQTPKRRPVQKAQQSIDDPIASGKLALVCIKLFIPHCIIKMGGHHYSASTFNQLCLILYR